MPGKRSQTAGRAPELHSHQATGQDARSVIVRAPRSSSNRNMHHFGVPTRLLHRPTSAPCDTPACRGPVLGPVRLKWTSWKRAAWRRDNPRQESAAGRAGRWYNGFFRIHRRRGRQRWICQQCPAGHARSAAAAITHSGAVRKSRQPMGRKRPSRRGTDARRAGMSGG